jgi:hypothetical protein
MAKFYFSHPHLFFDGEIMKIKIAAIIFLLLAASDSMAQDLMDKSNSMPAPSEILVTLKRGSVDPGQVEVIAV